MPQVSGNKQIEIIPFRDINGDTHWQDILRAVDVVIHLAAHAHVFNDPKNDDLIKYRRINTEGSINLGIQAARNNVKRFIFLSSIGVNGNFSLYPFKANDPPNPVEPYGCIQT